MRSDLERNVGKAFVARTEISRRRPTTARLQVEIWSQDLHYAKQNCDDPQVTLSRIFLNGTSFMSVFTNCSVTLNKLTSALQSYDRCGECVCRVLRDGTFLLRILETSKLWALTCLSRTFYGYDTLYIVLPSQIYSMHLSGTHRLIRRLHVGQ